MKTTSSLLLMPDLPPLSLNDVLADIHQLPSMPAVVDSLITSLDDEDVNVDALAQGIAKDQVLAARTLRTANSAFYGVQHKVASIHEAIVVLGLRSVGSLVIAVSVSGFFKLSPGSSFDLPRFWRHSFGAALCARALVQSRRLNTAHLNRESAFTAGLLHDIGALLLVTARPAYSARVMALSNEQNCSLQLAEQQVLGFDHAAVGSALTLRWRFPPAISQAVAYHHQPQDAATPTLADVVHTANALAHQLDRDATADSLAASIDAGIWQRLGLNEAFLLDLLAEIAPEHSNFCELLGAD